VTQIGGAEGTADTTALKFTFDKPVEGLTAENIVIATHSLDFGFVSTGSLSGGGTEWTLEITAVMRAGGLPITIARGGIDSASRTVAVYMSPRITFTVEQLGAVEGLKSSTGIKITFSEPVEDLTPEDIDVTNHSLDGHTLFEKGELTGGGAEWVLHLTLFPGHVEYTGSWSGPLVSVYISKNAVSFSGVGVNLYFGPLVSYTAVQVGGASGSVNSTGIKFTFDIPVENLIVEDISIANGKGAAAKGSTVKDHRHSRWHEEALLKRVF
jgi:hypothetical protein